jgi:hypothetical protein
VIQYEIATGKRKVLAFLAPAFEQEYDYVPAGTYGMKVGADGTTLYVNFNGHAGEKTRPPRHEAERVRPVRVRGRSRPRVGALTAGRSGSRFETAIRGAPQRGPAPNCAPSGSIPAHSFAAIHQRCVFPLMNNRPPDTAATPTSGSRVRQYNSPLPSNSNFGASFDHVTPRGAGEVDPAVGGGDRAGHRVNHVATAPRIPARRSRASSTATRRVC